MSLLVLGRRSRHHRPLAMPGPCPGFWDATVHRILTIYINIVLYNAYIVVCVNSNLVISHFLDLYSE
jgi:hypothetical protein